ncbi:NAD(P)H-binding protein, partial [Streptomyces sp. SID11233]|nr:NAD(P)H-binding protein [Streptomyces sp. SID11233]
MKLTVFGATGGVGGEAVRQALAAGHEVTAIVRDPAR